MPKRYNIRWNSEDKKELARLVKNFNTKLVRLQKQGFGDNFLPKKVSVKAIQDASPSRDVFNQHKKALSNFTKRNSEDIIVTERGVPMMKWEIEEMQTALKLVNTQRKNQLDKVMGTTATVAGISLPISRGQMGDERSSGLLPKKVNINKIRGRKEWVKLIESLNSELTGGKNKQYKSNYLKALEAAYSDRLGSQENELITKLIEHIKTLSDEEVEFKYRKDENADIDFIYAFENLMPKLEQLYSVWGLNWPDDKISLESDYFFLDDY